MMTMIDQAPVRSQPRPLVLHAVVLTAALVIASAPLAAQAQAAAQAAQALEQAEDSDHRATGVWSGVTGDVRLAPRLVATFTSEARRSEGVAYPRQLFGLAGLLVDVGRGIRVGAGYSGWHTSPSEEFGPRNPMRERRIWQQVSGAHRTFGAAWNHRFRNEQRWSAPADGGADRDWTYAGRARHQVRVVVPVDGRTPAATRLYVMPNVELFARTTNRSGALIDQTRFGTALGAGVAPRVNLEAGYMRQGFVRAGGVEEVHHVLQVTARVLTQAR